MSIARAFTTKRMKSQISSPMPSRSLTTKQSFPSGTIRHKISAPIELISTTNMLSYNAPDIYPSGASSNTSGDEFDLPGLSHSTATTPDSSSRGSTPSSPEPNHLSQFFGNTRQSTSTTSSSDDTPSIPARALSHTKKTHEILSRQRSISRMSSQRKPSQTSIVRGSVDMFSPQVETFDSHPFGQELAQVSELAEEFGVKENMEIIDEEEQELLSRGLCKFGAQDYLDEIQGLFSYAFDENPVPTQMWI